MGQSQGIAPKPILAASEALAKHALGHPEATESAPWGERAMKVKKKTFLFMRADATGLGLSVKLPQSSLSALALPFAEPTGYGLGKSGWVTFSFGPKADVPVGLLKPFIDESYRSIAPVKLSAAMGAPLVKPLAKPARKPTPKPTPKTVKRK